MKVSKKGVQGAIFGDPLLTLFFLFFPIHMGQSRRAVTPVWLSVLSGGPTTHKIESVALTAVPVVYFNRFPSSSSIRASQNKYSTSTSWRKASSPI